MNTKSVCIVLHNHFEVDLRVKRKAESLVSEGYDVDVLALHSKFSKSKEYELDGMHIHTISLGKKRGSLLRYAFEYLVFLLWAFYKVSVLHRKKRFAAIDVNNLPDFLVFAAAYAKWKGAKVVFDMHEVTPEFYMSKYKIPANSLIVRILQKIERMSFNYADYVININHTIEETLVKRGLKASKSTIVMNCVDEDFFTARIASGEAVGSQIPQPSFVMMYHGTVTHIYGLDIAIQAFGQVHTRMPGAEFWILGAGTEMKQLQDLAAQLGLGSKVRFLGQVRPQEIPHWIKRSDIGVLATRQDVFLDLSFSGKLSEYIIMGKPVIVSRLRTIRHYFTEEALTFFEPNNAEDLAGKMTGLYEDSARRQQTVRRAQEEYAPIRWSVMKERYLKLMAEATGNTFDTNSSAKPAADRERELASVDGSVSRS